MKSETLCQSYILPIKILIGILSLPLLWVWYLLITSHPKTFISIFYGEKFELYVNRENVILFFLFSIVLFSITFLSWKFVARIFFGRLLMMQSVLIFAIVVLLLSGFMVVN